jgi:cobalt-precorrin 5A hydrolase
MAGGEAMIAVGIGCRAGASVEAIVAAIRHACAAEASLHAPEKLRGHAALAEAAARLGWPLHWHSAEALRAAAPRVVSHSPRVQQIVGVGSVAEAAALAGAGEGAELVTPKFSRDGVSCAVAEARR